jgi:hypothetical protein
MKHKKGIKLLALAVFLYLLFPMVTGLFGIGDRDGPKIYPSSYHSILYMESYEIVRNEKPRSDPWLERPWFYGFPRKQRELKNEQPHEMSHNKP